MNTYRKFLENFLLERELDRPTREAARRSFEKFKKNFMVIMRDSVARFVQGAADKYTTGYPLTPEGIKYSCRDFLYAISNHKQKAYTINAINVDGVLRLHFFLNNETQLVLPSYITMKDFRKVVNKNNISLLQITLDGKQENFDGVYISGKDLDGGTPLVVLNNMKSLVLMDGFPLYTAISSVISGRLAGKSARTLLKPMNDWLDSLEKELSQKDSVYIHEFIHFFDDLRYKKGAMKPGNIKAGIKSSYDPQDFLKKDYYTSDSEWNAYFQAAAESVEDAVKSFLLAATSDFAAEKLFEKNPELATSTPIRKCKEMAEYVISDLYRKMGDSLIQDWARKHMVQLGIYNSGIGGVVPEFCLLFVSYGAYSTSSFLLAYPKKRKKFLSRIASLLGDVRNTIKEYNDRMSQGKAPTAQEFNTARTKFKEKFLDTSIPHNVYSNLYTGLMMGKKPFNPSAKIIYK